MAASLARGDSVGRLSPKRHGSPKLCSPTKPYLDRTPSARNSSYFRRKVQRLAVSFVLNPPRGLCAASRRGLWLRNVVSTLRQSIAGDPLQQATWLNTRPLLAPAGSLYPSRFRRSCLGGVEFAATSCYGMEKLFQEHIAVVYLFSFCARPAQVRGRFFRWQIMMRSASPPSCSGITFRKILSDACQSRDQRRSIGVAQHALGGKTTNGLRPVAARPGAQR